MPSASEKVVNRQLSGLEVKELLRRDFAKLLDGHGLLTDYSAYGKVSWRIVLSLDMDNYLTPRVDTFIDSSEFPENGEIRAATELTREVTSPNQERIRAGMDIPVEVKQHDGTTTVENIKYPENLVEGEGSVAISDVSERERREWGKKL